MSSSPPYGQTSSSPTQRWIARIATVVLLPLLSVALVGLLFEVGLRLIGYQAIYEVYSKPSLFWRHDELLGWSHEPLAAGEYVGPRPWPIEFRARVEINELGLRGPPVPPRGPGERRVLVLGDSVVAAFEVDYEDTFVAILERELRNRLEIPVRVINAGVRGYGTDQSYLYLRERAVGLEPSVVVFLHSGNDGFDNTTLHEIRRPFGKPAFALRDDGELELLGAPVPVYPICSELRLSDRFEPRRIDRPLERMMCRAQMLLFDRSALFSRISVALRADRELLRFLYGLGLPQARNPAQPEANDDPQTALAMALLTEMADEARAQGAHFLLTGFPTHLAQLDAGVLAEAGIDVHAIRDIEEAPATEVRWRHDGHLNPEGHRRVAAQLLSSIETKLRERRLPPRT